MKRSLLRWELSGIGVIFLVGAFFHFLFSFTGNWPPAGAIAPVNESVFEHLKMTFWPTLLWAVISYGFLKSTANIFVIAKAAALVTMPLAILALFYGYTAVFEESVIIDILIFLAAVAVGQYVNYLILKSNSLPSWLTGLSALLIITLGVQYALFTFYPPHNPLFIDTNTNAYGIPAD
jgi:hypothetical protein